MVEEQAISSELPSDEELKQIAFWIERVVAFLLVFCLFPITYHFLLPAMSMCLLLLSNYFYFTTYMYPLPQVIRAEPPPTSVPSIGDKSEGGGKLIKDEDIAFWIERAASCFLVLFWCLPRDKCWHILHLSAWLFCGCSIFYLYLDKKKPKLNESVTEPKKEVKPKHERNNKIVKKNVERQKAKLDDSTKETKEEVKAKDGRMSKIKEENTEQVKVKEDVKAKDERMNKIDKEKANKQKAELDDKAKKMKNEVKAKDERINEIDKGNTEQEKGKLDFGLKESKEEEAKDESMNTDEENTGQQEAKLKVSLKELKEEVRSCSKELQSMEAKYLAKIKKRVDLLQKNFDKFHGWEEERSQLMYELGAARASLGIYRELLHDLHYQP